MQAGHPEGAATVSLGAEGQGATEGAPGEEVSRLLGRSRARSPASAPGLAAGSGEPPAKRLRATLGANDPLAGPVGVYEDGTDDEQTGSEAEESGEPVGEGLEEEGPGASSAHQGGGPCATPPQPPLPSLPSSAPARSTSDVHAAALQLASLSGGVAAPVAAGDPGTAAAHGTSVGAVAARLPPPESLPSNALLHLSQRILMLYKRQQEQQPSPAAHLLRFPPEVQAQQQQQQEQQREQQQIALPAPPAQLAQAQPPHVQPLRPSTPVRRSCGAAGGAPVAGGAEDAQRRLAQKDEELAALRSQLAAAQRALTLQEHSRVTMAAELEWARGEARGAQVQRGAMEVLMAKNAELQEQVRQLSARQHMVQQQLVAAMAARERRHAEAQQLTADKEALQAQLADAGSRQRALHKQVAVLEGRASRAERELEGVRAARDWLAPHLDAAMTERARAEEELLRVRSQLAVATAELELWQSGQPGAGTGC